MRRVSTLVLAFLILLVDGPRSLATGDEDPESLSEEPKTLADLDEGQSIRLRITDTKDRFEATYLLVDDDSLLYRRVDAALTEGVPLGSVETLEAQVGTRERTDPWLYVFVGAAAIGGAIWAVAATKDKSTGIRILAGLGGAFAGVAFIGMMTPHGSGTQTVVVWVQVNLDKDP